MSFYFKKIELTNWLVYGGRQMIEFPPMMPKKNLVVIHGKNGFGKTSLLKALQFVFHGGRRDDCLEAWHDATQQKGEGKVEVALEFIHQNQQYKIIRGADIKPHGNTTAVYQYLELWLDGKKQDQAEDKIQQLIPKGSQQFIFFDGAEITRYAQKQHEDGIREAIEQILGIPSVRNLRYDLNKLITDLEREQTDIVSAERKNEALLDKIEDLESEKQSCENRLQLFKEKRQGIEKALKELRQEAAQIQVINAEHDHLEEKRARLKNLTDRKEEKALAIAELIKKAPLFMLEDILLDAVVEHETKDGSVQDTDTLKQAKQILEGILRDVHRKCPDNFNSCIINDIKTKLHNVNKALARPSQQNKDFLSQKEYILLSTLIAQLKNAPQNGENLMRQQEEIEQSIEEINTDILRLEKRVKGHSSVKVRDNYRQQDDYERELKTQNQEIGKTMKNLDEVQRKLKESRREIDSIATETNRGRGITRTLNTTRKQQTAVDELVNELVKIRREEIEQRATDIFTRITNKPIEYSGVRVLDDYTLEVYRKDGSTVANKQLSAGEKEVLAYSFITALNLTSPDPAPFVMDTPFGHLDSVHRDRLLKSLPNLKVQVFLLATDRDLPPKERSKFQYAIAEEYEIRRDQRKAKSILEKVEL